MSRSPPPPRARLGFAEREPRRIVLGKGDIAQRISGKAQEWGRVVRSRVRFSSSYHRPHDLGARSIEEA
jgi:hypothetical protein